MIGPSQPLSNQDGTEMSNLEQEIEDMMAQRRRDLEQRRRWAAEFRTQVLEDQERLGQDLEAGVEKIDMKRSEFRRGILPLLYVALSSLDTKTDADCGMHTDVYVAPTEACFPWTKPDLDDGTLAMHMSNVILDCEALLSCYEALSMVSEHSLRAPQARLGFEQDKEDTNRALMAVQRVAGVEMAARLTDGYDRIDKAAVLEEGEEELAAKVMSKAKVTSGRKMAQKYDSGSAWGVLATSLGRAVSGMQQLLE